MTDTTQELVDRLSSRPQIHSTSAISSAAYAKTPFDNDNVLGLEPWDDPLDDTNGHLHGNFHRNSYGAIPPVTLPPTPKDSPLKTNLERLRGSPIKTPRRQFRVPRTPSIQTYESGRNDDYGGDDSVSEAESPFPIDEFNREYGPKSVLGQGASHETKHLGGYQTLLSSSHEKLMRELSDERAKVAEQRREIDALKIKEIEAARLKSDMETLRGHNQTLRSEIQTLRARNLSLEVQVNNFQRNDKSEQLARENKLLREKLLKYKNLYDASKGGPSSSSQRPENQVQNRLPNRLPNRSSDRHYVEMRDQAPTNPIVSDNVGEFGEEGHLNAGDFKHPRHLEDKNYDPRNFSGARNPETRDTRDVTAARESSPPRQNKQRFSVSQNAPKAPECAPSRVSVPERVEPQVPPTEIPSVVPNLEIQYAGFSDYLRRIVEALESQNSESKATSENIEVPKRSANTHEAKNAPEPSTRKVYAPGNSALYSPRKSFESEKASRVYDAENRARRDDVPENLPRKTYESQKDPVQSPTKIQETQKPSGRFTGESYESPKASKHKVNHMEKEPVPNPKSAAREDAALENQNNYEQNRPVTRSDCKVYFSRMERDLRAILEEFKRQNSNSSSSNASPPKCDCARPNTSPSAKTCTACSSVSGSTGNTRPQSESTPKEGNDTQALMGKFLWNRTV
ncbi:hypothetical protein JCM33374_g1253 [Metschnikowia sp. JCM 33374]|nr:hypothetical protein JCM33374_g1253 [Metschnikowia sp. JCM 33374]